MDEFLKVMKERQPIKNQKILFNLAEEVGMRPRWKIRPKIKELMKEKQIIYQRKRPFGWVVV